MHEGQFDLSNVHPPLRTGKDSARDNSAGAEANDKADAEGYGKVGAVDSKSNPEANTNSKANNAAADADAYT